jgi:hypothetical protein
VTAEAVGLVAIALACLVLLVLLFWPFEGPGFGYPSPEEQLRRGDKSITFVHGPAKVSNQTAEEMVASDDD